MTATGLTLEQEAWVRGFIRAYAMFGREVPLDPVPYLPYLMQPYGRTLWGTDP